MNRNEVNEAIEAADKALHDESFSWIRKSSLYERAYYLGVYTVLESLTDEGNLKKLLLRTLINTIEPRVRDDTFPSTQIGRLYGELRNQVMRFADKSIQCVDEQDVSFDDKLKQLDRLIEERDHFWRYHLRGSQELLRDLQNMSEQFGSPDPPERNLMHHRIWETLERLKEVLRVVALLETDHHRWRSKDT